MYCTSTIHYLNSLVVYGFSLTEYVKGSTTMKWVLVGITDQNQRGTYESLRRKIVSLRETVRQEELQPVDISAQTKAELQQLGKAQQLSEVKVKEMLHTQQKLQHKIKQLEATVQHQESTLQGLHELNDATKQQLAQSESNRQQGVRRAEQAEQQRDIAVIQATSAEERATLAERRVAEADEKLRNLEMHWIIQKEEIHVSSTELGRGGWAEVKVAEFRGTQVAAKCFYRELSSKYYEQMFFREMKMASQLRHPNLVQFIGATSLAQGQPIILTELMTTSLRELLKAGPIEYSTVVSISLDVVRALNYLHLMRPRPLIHRDISSANVLLDPVPTQCWKAKVADYGSVNLVQKLQTVGPGSPIYAAPEAVTPALQSPKMDIFSFGVLLVEMLTDQFPEEERRSQLIASIDHSRFVALIKQCLHQERDKRPSAGQLLLDLNNVL